MGGEHRESRCLCQVLSSATTPHPQTIFGDRRALNQTEPDAGLALTLAVMHVDAFVEIAVNLYYYATMLSSSCAASMLSGKPLSRRALQLLNRGIQGPCDC